MTQDSRGGVHRVKHTDEMIGAGIFAELEAQQLAAEKAAETKRLIQTGLVECMRTPASRAAMAWLLKTTGVNESVTSTDPMRMMQASAKRDVGLALRDALLEACPEKYAQMMREDSNGRRDYRNDGSD